jgi:hypothetical protein
VSENQWVERLLKQSTTLWFNWMVTTKPLSDEFENDCLIWMLFNGSNRIASANDLAWNGKKWAIANHFVPYTETEVIAPDRFESDFMVQYLVDKELSQEAQVGIG